MEYKKSNRLHKEKNMSKVSIEILQENTKPITCVLGCLTNERGLIIKKQLIEWLSSKYDVIVVNQEYPGDLYEFPALNYAKNYSLKNKKPVLYLHTKGAFNSNQININVRKIWKQEFFDNYDWYYDNLLKENDKAVVLGPFIADLPFGITWFNGFLANEKAWNLPDLDIPRNERWSYEFLFKDKIYTPISRLITGVNNQFIDEYKDKFKEMINYVSLFQ